MFKVEKIAKDFLYVCCIKRYSLRSLCYAIVFYHFFFFRFQKINLNAQV
jgi:hypothetical protein